MKKKMFIIRGEKLKSDSHSIDMLSGSLLPKIIAFALPLAAASILQQLFNAADVAVVGRFADGAGMAAVGANGPIVNILVGFATGLAVGVNVHIAGLIGKGDEDAVHESIQTIIFLSVVVGVIIGALGIIFSRPVLVAMNTPENVLGEAITYLRVYSLGIPFAMLYNCGAAVLRSRGDTRRPLYILAICGLINIILNIIFVVGLHTGVVGVAIATDISGIISAIIVFGIIIREETTESFFKRVSIHRGLSKRILRIGLPAAFQGMLFSMSNIIIQAALNGFGADAMAGNTAAVNFEYISFFIAQACSQTAMTFISQNLGAGNEERCKKSFALSVVLAIASQIVINTGFVLAGEYLLRVFSTDPVVISYGLQRLRMVVLLHFLISTYEITAGALRGYGYSMTPTVISVIGTCIIRPLWIGTYFAAHPTLINLLYVYPVSWIITGIMMTVAYFWAMNNRKKYITNT